MAGAAWQWTSYRQRDRGIAKINCLVRTQVFKGDVTCVADSSQFSDDALRRVIAEEE
ncbi:hypothetical protein CHELA1G2_11733 [Hyphomicrobiales bacterium]|nr:hypothetical protein CHELA1G2_11733 [Hyphomicrobiales bacterium]